MSITPQLGYDKGLQALCPIKVLAVCEVRHRNNVLRM